MMPRYLINPTFYKKIYEYSDCIVIGSGIAGLSTARRLSTFKKVKVLTKSSLSESNTWYAQGGVAAAIKKPDNWKKHYRDTLKAGQDLCDKEAVKILARNAPDMIRELIEIGVKFDISEGEISLTTEGGHSLPRIVHAGGDATGEELEKKMVSHTRNISKIELLSGYLVTDILTYQNKCMGVMGLNPSTLDIEIHPSSNVIIASGGLGQIYRITTNPSITTGDGIAMAYRAGVSIKDIEFVQFHPTVFRTKENKLFLISEALRGEGAYLKDCNGKRFMIEKHPLAELAPRDIVVKEMVKVLKRDNCDYIYLDATHIPEKTLKIRFPNIISKLKENNLDLKKDLVKVSPAAHYLNGGIKTDYNGSTNIEGLYCCGEAASTGAHGANRLASNSLIEGLVFSKRIYTHIKNKKSSAKKDILSYIKKLSLGKSNKDAGKKLDIDRLKSKLKNIMSSKVGISRDIANLKEAQKFVETHLHNKYLYNKMDKEIIEFANMLVVSGLIIKSAIIREESRGTHQRNDFPAKDNKNWQKHIILKKDKVYYDPVK